MRGSKKNNRGFPSTSLRGRLAAPLKCASLRRGSIAGIRSPLRGFSSLGGPRSQGGPFASLRVALGYYQPLPPGANTRDDSTGLFGSVRAAIPGRLFASLRVALGYPGQLPPGATASGQSFICIGGKPGNSYGRTICLDTLFHFRYFRHEKVRLQDSQSLPFCQSAVQSQHELSSRNDARACFKRPIPRGALCPHHAIRTSRASCP